jgi:hypothetical protein
VITSLFLNKAFKGGCCDLEGRRRWHFDEGNIMRIMVGKIGGQNWVFRSCKVLDYGKARRWELEAS